MTMSMNKKQARIPNKTVSTARRNNEVHMVENSYLFI